MRAHLGIVALVSLAACSPRPEVKAEGAWVRLPAVAGQPGAAYFTVRGGMDDDTLVAVSAPFALKAEMHESTTDAAGMAKMQALKDVAIPAGGKVPFAPGGRHVMLFDIAPQIKPGDRVTLTLSFASGKALRVPADVTGAGTTR